MRATTWRLVVVIAVAVAVAAPPAGASLPIPPMLTGDLPDPHIITVGGRHWLHTTNVFPFGFTINVPVHVSDDLVTWTYAGDALPRLGTWATPGRTWAPGVAEVPGAVVLYYVATEAASGRQCIGVATAAGPQGPFVDSGAQPLVCERAEGGSLDPDPFRAADGRLYLYWKVNGNALDRATAIRVRELQPGGTAFVAGSSAATVLASDGGPAWERGIIENPHIARGADGSIWLLYSGGFWESAGYATGVARCGSPLGPCTRWGPSPWLGSASAPAGPGGADVFVDRAGRPRVVFHGWPGAVGYAAGGERWDYTAALDVDAAGPRHRFDLPAAAADPRSWAPFPTPEALVDQQYADLLARPPDPAGRAFWSALLRDGRAVGLDVVTSFFSSSEYAGDVQPVARLYFAAFGRRPDLAGLVFWVGRLQAGMPLAEVADWFAASDEFRARYEGTDDAQYVDALYVNVLGRGADPAGLAYWSGRLAAGTTRAEVLLGLSESAEHRAASRSRTLVVGAYLGLLAREPDDAGFAYWVGRLDSGLSLRSFLGGFLASAEYARRVAG